MKHIEPHGTDRLFVTLLWAFLVCVLLATAISATGCAKNFYRPDGTLEHTEQLDPAAAALIGKVIEVAAQIATADTPGEEVVANEQAATVEDILIDLLPDDTQDAARRAIQAAKDDDWAALIEAIADLRDAQQKLGGK